MDMRLFGSAFVSAPPTPRARPALTHPLSGANSRRSAETARTREQIVHHVTRNGPMGMWGLVEAFPGVASSTMYQHLKVLVDAGVLVRGKGSSEPKAGHRKARGTHAAPSVWATPGRLVPVVVVRKEHLVRADALAELMADGGWHTVWWLAERIAEPVHRSNIVRTLVRMQKEGLTDTRRVGRTRSEWRLKRRPVQ